ncbi:MAG TPA: ribbon-helix-helix protein, CopG family [Polyangia bacterium]|nr:ribbon-helix-helix protein, CopG family [Polyangia bacterium]
MLKTMGAVIKVRCTAQEKARVAKLAEKAKMSLSDFVRVRLEASR